MVPGVSEPSHSVLKISICTFLSVAKLSTNQFAFVEPFVLTQGRLNRRGRCYTAPMAFSIIHYVELGFLAHANFKVKMYQSGSRCITFVAELP